jgi:hypothetical protein
VKLRGETAISKRGFLPVSIPGASWIDHPELRTASRLTRALGTGQAVVARYGLAFLCGIGAAAAVALVDLHLRLPGSSILKATLPVALGLAIAPQRGSGLVISGGALVAVAFMKRFFGIGGGLGALTSLLALGPVLELLLWNAKNGWGLYLRFAAAGVLANCLAFAVRGGGKAAGLDGLSMRPLADWLTVAPWTYAACGLVAGLFSGLLLFRSRRLNGTLENRLIERAARS